MLEAASATHVAPLMVAAAFPPFAGRVCISSLAEISLLDPKRLLKALNDDLNACREVLRFSSSDEDRERGDLEFSTLRKHIVWAESASYDQAELERIIRSLEENTLLGGYQRWRKRSEAD